MTTPKPATPLPFDTAEYWQSLARSERAFARQELKGRHGTVESIRIHLANAEDYEKRARALLIELDRERYYRDVGALMPRSR